MAKAALLLALMLFVALCLQHEVKAAGGECVVSGDCVARCGGCQRNLCIRGNCLCGCHPPVRCTDPEDCKNMCGQCSRGCMNSFCFCQC